MNHPHMTRAATGHVAWEMSTALHALGMLFSRGVEHGSSRSLDLDSIRENLHTEERNILKNARCLLPEVDVILDLNQHPRTHGYIRANAT
jgi:hypothetical protein